MTTCENCKYFDSHGGASGACRRNPPSAIGWARTSRADWCGEFVAAPIPMPKPVSVSKPVLVPAPAPKQSDTPFMDQVRGRPPKKT